MPLSITCRCGKQLRVRDELAGKRVRCPACGEVLSVPPERAGPSKPVPRTIATSKIEPPEEEDAAPAPRPTVRKLPKKLKKRSRSSSFRLLPADLPIVPALIVILLLAGAGVGAYFLFRPSPAYQVVEVKRVDVHTALAGLRDRLPLVTQAGANVTLGGRTKLMVTRESDQGAYLLVQLKVSQKYLSDKGAIQQSSVIINNHDVLLQGTDKPVEAMFLAHRYEDQARGVSVGLRGPLGGMGLNLQMLPAPEALGQLWFHEGTFEGELPKLEKESDQPPKSFSFRFKGKRGMEVAYQLQGGEDLLKVTWDAGSTGWQGQGQFERTEHGIFNVDWDVTCLFPRPEGTELKLTVLKGEPLVVQAP